MAGWTGVQQIITEVWDSVIGAIRVSVVGAPATQPVSGTVSVYGGVTSVIGVDSLSVLVDQGAPGGDPWLVSPDIGVAPGGTATPARAVVVQGKSNDPVPVYQPVPLGPSGRSTIVEGFTGGVPLSVAMVSGVAVTSMPTPALDQSIQGILERIMLLLQDIRDGTANTTIN